MAMELGVVAEVEVLRKSRLFWAMVTSRWAVSESQKSLLFPLGVDGFGE